jgi:TRAP-type mannitol/chloroaromatic compound transport system substrate-binding protein
MKRRQFLAAGGGWAGVTIAAPAIAQSAPSIKWRCTSSFPKTLDTIFGAGDVFTKAVAEATDRRFEIQLFAPGEIVPPFSALDAVQNGTVECAHSGTLYYVGKDPTFSFGTTMPFGLNARQQNAWWSEGGGAELFAEFLKDYNVVAFAAGNTGAQMGGFFRKEINSLADLQGLKMRIAGIGGRVMARLGVVPQQLGPGEIYPALERGTIDATEWIGPYDDIRLGFHKVAPFYYGPGWFEGGALTHIFVNQQSYERLPKAYQQILQLAAAKAHNTMLERYDARNMKALKDLLGQGANLRFFPRDVLDKAYDESFAMYDEIARENPRFKKMYENWSAFRQDVVGWFRLNEVAFDTYVAQRVSRSRG